MLLDAASMPHAISRQFLFTFQPEMLYTDYILRSKQYRADFRSAIGPRIYAPHATRK